jgi:hypothetical protein
MESIKEEIYKNGVEKNQERKKAKAEDGTWNWIARWWWWRWCSLRIKEKNFQALKSKAIQ